MPYDANSDLPEQVRNAASTACQTVFRNAFNSIEENNPDLSESELFQRAWGSMQNTCSRDSEDDGYTKDQSSNMRLEPIVNEVEPRREKDDGKEYLVAPVRFIKNMDLNLGYVPEDEIRESTMDWDGTPVVPDHPTQNGQFVTVKSGIEDPIGEIRNPQTIVTNDTVTMGEVWIDPDAAREAGHSEILEAIEEGDTLSVSSAYQGDKLNPGDYDGQYRENVRGNLNPDHVAVFSDKEGQCSIDDGCFVGPNADVKDHEVVVNVSAVGDGDDTDDSGDSDEDAVDSTDDLNDDAPGIRETVVNVLESWGIKKQKDMKRTDLLVNEYGFDRENLPSEDTQCFDRIYEQFAANEDDGSDNDAQGQQSDGSDADDSSPDDGTDDGQTTDGGTNDGMNIDKNDLKEVVSDTLDEKGFVKQDDIGEVVADAISANQERSEKQELVDTLIANGDYDEDDRESLMDYPKAALSDLEDNIEVEKKSDYSAMRGASPSISSNDADSEGWMSPIANQNMEEGEN